MITALVPAAAARMRQRSREATSSAASNAAGHTLIQVATASRIAAARGRAATKSTPTMASGIVMESILPIAIGPSRIRKPIHHQPIRTPERERLRPLGVRAPGDRCRG